MNQLKRAIERFCTLETVRALKGYAADIDRGFFFLCNTLCAGSKIVFDSMQVGCQFFGTILFAVQLAKNTQCFICFIIKGRIAAGNHNNRNPGLILQLVGVNVCIRGHDNDLRTNIDDFLYKRFAVRAGYRQRAELVKIHIVIQAGHTGFGFVILNADNQVLRLHIAGVAQRAYANANNTFNRLRNFRFAAISIGDRPGGGFCVRGFRFGADFFHFCG